MQIVECDWPRAIVRCAHRPAHVASSSSSQGQGRTSMNRSPVLLNIVVLAAIRGPLSSCSRAAGFFFFFFLLFISTYYMQLCNRRWSLSCHGWKDGHVVSFFLSILICSRRPNIQCCTCVESLEIGLRKRAGSWVFRLSSFS